MATYSKPYLTPKKQLDLLKSRGMEVEETSALECLQRNGYYRLSAYWYPFRRIENDVRTDEFLPGSRFEDARALYVFDKDLKSLLMDAIERVEIAVRVAIALRLGEKDVFAHLNPHLLDHHFVAGRNGFSRYQNWLTKYNTRLQRASDQFILHYENKYGSRSPLPIWIAIELWDFGLLSHFYRGMKLKDTRVISAKFQVPDPYMLASWLQSLNYVRNVIAHHGRLWNLNLIDTPSLPKQGAIPAFDPLAALPSVHTRLYSICCILAYLSHAINPQSSWCEKLVKHIEAFPEMPYAKISDMGFPNDWKTHAFWV